MPMMMVNQSCRMPMSYWTASEVAFHLAYHFVTPLYIVLGLLGHSLFLAVCCRSSREGRREFAYFYQIVLGISDLLSVVTSSVWYSCIACNGLIGAERGGPLAVWFRSQYGLVWIFARLASPLMNACFTNSLLLAVCMATDRVFALVRPYAYRSSNHVHRLWSLIICAFLSISTSVFDCFRRRVVVVEKDGGLEYRVEDDEQFMHLPVVNVLNHTRNLLRLIGLIALIICNALLIHYYRSRFARVAHFGGGGSSTKSDRSDHHPSADESRPLDGKSTTDRPPESTTIRKDAERTILVFVLYQSITNALSVTALIVYYFLIYLAPDFSRCGIFFMFPSMNLACMLTYGFGFYVVLACSQQCRRLVKELFQRRSSGSSDYNSL